MKLKKKRGTVRPPQKTRSLQLATMIIAAVAVAAIGFGLGRLSAKPDTYVLPEPAATSTPLPAPTTAPVDPLPEQGLPEPQSAAPNAEAQQASTQPLRYTLKLAGEKLQVTCVGEEIAKLDIPGQIDEQTTAELIEGMAFHTLEEVESWLESMDS